MSSDLFSCEILDIRDRETIEQLEEMLYLSFVEKIPNNWILSRYTKINNRLIPDIPYDQLRIYLLKKQNIIIAGIGICLDPSIKLSAEDFGFVIKNRAGICNGAFFFANGFKGLEFFEIYNLFNFLTADLIKKEIKYIYGTCDHSLFKMYHFFGYELIEKKQYKDTWIDFIRLDLINESKNFIS